MRRLFNFDITERRISETGTARLAPFSYTGKNVSSMQSLILCRNYGDDAISGRQSKSDGAPRQHLPPIEANNR